MQTQGIPQWLPLLPLTFLHIQFRLIFQNEKFLILIHTAHQTAFDIPHVEKQENLQRTSLTRPECDGKEDDRAQACWDRS